MRDNIINQAAFDWLVRDDAGLSPVEQAEFKDWVAADPRHYGAYMRARAVWLQSHRIKALSNAPDPATWAFVSPNTKLQEPAENHRSSLQSEIDTRPVGRRRAIFAIGGAVAALGMSSWLWTPSAPAHATSYKTRRGEKKEIILQDGSRVELNTDTEILVNFNNRQRKIRLLHGEAMCQISRERTRPFLIDTENFRAVTKAGNFIVQNVEGARPQLVVTQGTVDVITPKFSPLRVTEKTKITFVDDKSVIREALRPDDMTRELLWREGKVAFTDTTVRSAISTFGRYNTKKIEILDATLLDKTITGVFTSNDPLGFAHVLAQLFDARVQERNDAITVTANN